MAIKVDLHNHLASLEYIGSDFEKIVSRAEKNLGKSGVFTVLNSLRCYRGGFLGRKKIGPSRYQSFIDLGNDRVEEHKNFAYIPKKDLYVLYGQEVLTKDGHILVLGMDKDVKLPDKKSIEWTVKTAKEEYNATVIASHPKFLDGVVRTNETEFLRNVWHFDGFEVHTGESWVFPFSNSSAKSYYRWLLKRGFDIGAVCSSDGHSSSEIGSSYSVIESLDFTDEDKLRESLKKRIREHKDYSNDKRRSSFIGALDHAAKGFSGRVLYKLGLFPQTT